MKMLQTTPPSPSGRILFHNRG